MKQLSASRSYLDVDVLVEVVLLSVLLEPFLLLFLCTFLVLEELDVVEDVLVFCLLAAGAAIRNGTARAVNRVLVTNFFI